MHIRDGNDLLALCRERGIRLSELGLIYEEEKTGKTREEIREAFHFQLRVMRESAHQALQPGWTGRGKIIGGEAGKIRSRYETTEPLCGKVMARAVSFALSSAEVNACMGRIVAAPTAGSCGVLPGVLFSLAESHGVSEDRLVEGLLTAGMVGMVIAKNGTGYNYWQ